MILNNYRSMQWIRELREESLTPELVLELQRIVTEEALDDPQAAGRLRKPGTAVVVDDLHGTVFHLPPSAEQRPERMEQMCAFANGRTARALFYWAMLHQNYWLFEFISISSVINRARGKYELSFLYAETDDNDLTYFLLALLRYALRHPGFRYTVASHQASHGVSNQTARSDLQKLVAQDLLLSRRQGRKEVFAVPADLAQRLPDL